MKHPQSCWKRKKKRNPEKMSSGNASFIAVTQVAYSKNYIFNNYKLWNDKGSCKIRKENPSDFQTYSHSIDDLPDEYWSLVHGYHRLCHKKFTNVSKPLKHQTTTGTGDLSQHLMKRRRVWTDANTSALFSNDRCHFATGSEKTKKE